ncbi:MAG: hypothetical protein NW206_14960 [Hyphomonadaceae bacterium]|nr:hypothetical protein [Hyphomonadaceae bacterium]
MYFITVVALTFLLPVGFTIWELIVAPGANVVLSFGKWTAFFAVGVRLFIAGLRQALQPNATLRQSFDIEDAAPAPIVQELGFANLAMGAMGLLALLHPLLTFAAALMGGLFYGLAGLKQGLSKQRNFDRNLSMTTDLWAFVVLALYAGWGFGAVAALM